MRTLRLYRDRPAAGLWITTVLLLLASSGCKSVRPDGPTLGPKPTPPGRWTEERIQNGWITVDVGLPYDGRPPYAVLLNPVIPDHELLSRRIGVVRWRTNWEILKGLKPKPSASPSLKRPPGPTPEPVGRWLLRADRPGIVGRAYFQLITTEAHSTVPHVVDYLMTMPDVDASRIAISGSSTSGFMALEAMAEEPRLALGVVQVACGDYWTFLRSSSLGLDDQARWLVDGRMVLDPDYAAELKAIAPIGQADRLPPRPLLLLSGGEDRAIPPACVQATAARFSKAYDDAGYPKRFDWIEFADRGHNLDQRARRIELQFLERWLIGGRGRRLLDEP